MSTRATVTLALAAGVLGIVAVAASCASLIGFATRESRDWKFVQSIGGIAVGTPYRDEDGRVFLPLDCDVSGTKTVTVLPTTANSGLACGEPEVRVRSQSIELTIRTELVQKDGNTAQCPAADLGELPAGEYSVVYADPDGSRHPLGTIQVPAK